MKNVFVKLMKKIKIRPSYKDGYADPPPPQHPPSQETIFRYKMANVLDRMKNHIVEFSDLYLVFELLAAKEYPLGCKK